MSEGEGSGSFAYTELCQWYAIICLKNVHAARAQKYFSRTRIN